VAGEPRFGNRDAPQLHPGCKRRTKDAHGWQGTKESCRTEETIITYWYRMSSVTCKWFGCCGIAAGKAELEM
jgi:hypothetical protein